MMKKTDRNFIKRFIISSVFIVMAIIMGGIILSPAKESSSVGVIGDGTSNILFSGNPTYIIFVSTCLVLYVASLLLHKPKKKNRK
jgi:hypothetical protein